MTLRPIKKKERQLFWDFRADDIVDMFNVKCSIAIITWLVALVFYCLDTSDSENYIRLIGFSLYVLLYFVTFLITRRFKKCFIYTMPVLFICTGLLQVASALIMSP